MDVSQKGLRCWVPAVATTGRRRCIDVSVHRDISLDGKRTDIINNNMLCFGYKNV